MFCFSRPLNPFGRGRFFLIYLTIIKVIVVMRERTSKIQPLSYAACL
nr:MAG TPA: hypothetical protein [Caudoviricetes sp.]DAE90727.1 MAG TPA: hypothetical protein [Caudoviricetes sp.]